MTDQSSTPPPSEPTPDPERTVSLGPEARGASELSAAMLERLAARTAASMRYRLRGEIAHGGMGAILRVWDEDLRRDLAMKVMLEVDEEARRSAHHSSEQRKLTRFLEEAQVTGQLDHPSIVPVHELGLDALGRVYFTMKLVQGQTLKQVFDEYAKGEGGWTELRVLGLLQRVCEAMSYAHAKGVIHRDLKPSNVMVGRYGEVFVMDWGLSRILAEEDQKDIRVRPEAEPQTAVLQTELRGRPGDTPDSPIYTMDGDVVGTPAYMPPEQAAGRIGEMGPHSDVYALGAMLYHLLAGHMPYVPRGERLGNRVVWNLVQSGPPRPLHEVAPEAAPELVAICERAMARDPAVRYADMSELALDLSAYVEGRVVRAYESGAWAQARKWAGRNKALAASLAVALFLAFGGAGSVAYVQAAGKRVADEQRALATARAEDVLRLSALQDLDDLEAQADELWPADPQHVAEMQAWITRAEGLYAELPRHRAKQGELATLELSTHEEAGARWWKSQLAKLIAGLDGLGAGLLAKDAIVPGRGWSVPKRLAFANELSAGSAPGGAHRVRWEQDLPAIRAAYPGLELGPQTGLLPLGPDPATGLWEFAHLMTGEAPERGADGRLVIGEDSAMVLVLLPGGRFFMGSQSSDPTGRNYDPLAESDETVHEVALSPFFLSKYELTQAQWQRLTGRNPSYYQEHAQAALAPVENVSWLDCTEWLARAGLALPSEAQWEYGARAGTDTPWWTGAERDSLREKHAANLADQTLARSGSTAPGIGDWPELDDGFAVHAPVGSFAANAFGLHEVHGNVWEWCQDSYDENFYRTGPLQDPEASVVDGEVVVLRGGSYLDPALNARAALRLSFAPTFAESLVGVRPARTLER